MKREALNVPDLHFLRAAEGWLELGLTREAVKELGQISRRNAGHPDVLACQWLIAARRKRWDLCLTTASNMTIANRKDVRGWLYLSRTFRAIGRLKVAFTLLHVQLKRFPSDWELRFDLARLAFESGDVQQSLNFLSEAVDLGDGAEVWKRFQEDASFAALRQIGGVDSGSGRTNRKRRVYV